MRTGMSHTDWHLANGQLAYESRGKPVSLFEYKLEGALIAPLPKARDLDPAHFRLESKSSTGGGSCLTILPARDSGEPKDAAGTGEAEQRPEQGPFPTYCFDADAPVLRSVYSFERVLTQFVNVRQTQGRYLAHQIEIGERGRKLLTATVDVVEPISLPDPALVPPSTALKTEIFDSQDVSLNDVEIDQSLARGMLMKRTEPVYPSEARRAGIQGKVVLEAMIGTDGRIHDLRVISAPAASLAASSFAAVSQWEYRPYLMNGRTVPVQTTVMVTFALER
jgi:TonB family protein